MSGGISTMSLKSLYATSSLMDAGHESAISRYIYRRESKSDEGRTRSIAISDEKLGMKDTLPCRKMNQEIPLDPRNKEKITAPLGGKGGFSKTPQNKTPATMIGNAAADCKMMRHL